MTSNRVDAERGRDRPTRERTRELLDRAVDADPDERRLIREEVVSLHLWLADRAARRYGPPNDLDDLVRVARSGLAEAFDRSGTSEPTTYAYVAWVTVHDQLRRHLRDPRVPEHPSDWHLVDTQVLLQRAPQNLTGQERELLQLWLVEEMTQAQIAAVTEITPLQVSRLLARLMATLRAETGEPDA